MIKNYIVKEIREKANLLKYTNSKDRQIHCLDMLEALIKLARENVGY